MALIEPFPLKKEIQENEETVEKEPEDGELEPGEQQIDLKKETPYEEMSEGEIASDMESGLEEVSSDDECDQKANVKTEPSSEGFENPVSSKDFKEPALLHVLKTILGNPETLSAVRKELKFEESTEDINANDLRRLLRRKKIFSAKIQQYLSQIVNFPDEGSSTPEESFKIKEESSPQKERKEKIKKEKNVVNNDKDENEEGEESEVVEKKGNFKEYFKRLKENKKEDEESERDDKKERVKSKPRQYRQKEKEEDDDDEEEEEVGEEEDGVNSDDEKNKKAKVKEKLKRIREKIKDEDRERNRSSGYSRKRRSRSRNRSRSPKREDYSGRKRDRRRSLSPKEKRYSDERRRQKEREREKERSPSSRNRQNAKYKPSPIKPRDTSRRSFNETVTISIDRKRSESWGDEENLAIWPYEDSKKLIGAKKRDVDDLSTSSGDSDLKKKSAKRKKEVKSDESNVSQPTSPISKKKIKTRSYSRSRSRSRSRSKLRSRSKSRERFKSRSRSRERPRHSRGYRSRTRSRTRSRSRSRDRRRRRRSRSPDRKMSKEKRLPFIVEINKKLEEEEKKKVMQETTSSASDPINATPKASSVPSVPVVPGVNQLPEGGYPPVPYPGWNPGLHPPPMHPIPQGSPMPTYPYPHYPAPYGMPPYPHPPDIPGPPRPPFYPHYGPYPNFQPPSQMHQMPSRPRTPDSDIEEILPIEPKSEPSTFRSHENSNSSWPIDRDGSFGTKIETPPPGTNDTPRRCPTPGSPDCITIEDEPEPESELPVVEKEWFNLPPRMNISMKDEDELKFISDLHKVLDKHVAQVSKSEAIMCYRRLLEEKRQDELKLNEIKNNLGQAKSRSGVKTSTPMRAVKKKDNGGDTGSGSSSMGAINNTSEDISNNRQNSAPKPNDLTIIRIESVIEYLKQNPIIPVSNRFILQPTTSPSKLSNTANKNESPLTKGRIQLNFLNSDKDNEIIQASSEKENLVDFQFADDDDYDIDSILKELPKDDEPEISMPAPVLQRVDVGVQCNTTDGIIKYYKDKSKYFEFQVSQLSNANANLEEAFKQSKENFDKKQKELQLTRQILEEKETELENVKKTHNQKPPDTTEFQRLMKRCDDLYKDNKNFRAQISKKDKEINGYKNCINELHKDKEDLDKQLKDKENLSKELSDREDLSKELKDKDDLIEELRLKISKLETAAARSSSSKKCTCNKVDHSKTLTDSSSQTSSDDVRQIPEKCIHDKKKYKKKHVQCSVEVEDKETQTDKPVLKLTRSDPFDFWPREPGQCSDDGPSTSNIKTENNVKTEPIDEEFLQNVRIKPEPVEFDEENIQNASIPSPPPQNVPATPPFSSPPQNVPPQNVPGTPSFSPPPENVEPPPKRSRRRR